jgi:phosphoribosylamine--glycine ligase
LANFDIRWKDEVALVVVMAAKGYPGSYQKGTLIEGLADAAAVPGAMVFHAGTKSETRAGQSVVTASGGRVLGIAASAKTVSAAQKIAYAAVDDVRWPDGFCRRDIGWRAVAREKTSG